MISPSTAAGEAGVPGRDEETGSSAVIPPASSPGDPEPLYLEHSDIPRGYCDNPERIRLIIRQCRRKLEAVS